MIRYTVTYSPDALASLADAWIASADKSHVTKAGEEIDRTLATDASNKGDEVREGLRKLRIHPLRVLFSVDEGDRVVTIWAVRLIRDQ